MSDQPFGKRGAPAGHAPARGPADSETPRRGPPPPGAGVIVVTTNDLPGYRIVEYLGVARGITVRSRSVVGNFVGSVQSIFGGQIGAFMELAEAARREAYDHLVSEARLMGANAVLAMRYDGNEITDGVTEVLAYGTAVVVESV
ncbi:heavy metal-binding domain-containing protein [Methylopila sp. M107]|uniref:YbjQ family protein n=1 Tax=Methylopila sp. M107 TaxID=1101190 RepID=UPI00036DE1F6|nr:heavy metal-binding domain-containing protein [Methylopila sp. M107]